MAAPEQMLDLYLHLACAAEAEARPLTRDKFLILAAGVAQTAGYAGIAEDCRLRVLEHNPNHMLKYFATIREAMRSSEIRHYVRQLFRLYPFEKAEFLLAQYRASGYSGHHGYLGLEQESTAAPPRRKRRSPRQRRTQKGHRGPRPSLRRAMAAVERAMETQERRQAAAREQRAAASDAAYQPDRCTRPPIERARFWSTLILVFSVGVLLGGLAIAWLFPSY